MVNNSPPKASFYCIHILTILPIINTLSAVGLCCQRHATVGPLPSTFRSHTHTASAALNVMAEPVKDSLNALRCCCMASRYGRICFKEQKIRGRKSVFFYLQKRRKQLLRSVSAFAIPLTALGMWIRSEHDYYNRYMMFEYCAIGKQCCAKECLSTMSVCYNNDRQMSVASYLAKNDIMPIHISSEIEQVMWEVKKINVVLTEAIIRLIKTNISVICVYR